MQARVKHPDSIYFLDNMKVTPNESVLLPSSQNGHGNRWAELWNEKLGNAGQYVVITMPKEAHQEHWCQF